jgi:cell division septation protein DedD
MEKRQAVILLILILVVALGSFTLGVIVGRRGSERDLARQLQRTEKILVAQTLPPESVTTPITDVPEKTTPAPAEPVAGEPKLSFYDDLSKDIVPLGSGINLAPVVKQEPVKVVTPPVDLPEHPIVKKKVKTVQESSVVVKTTPRKKPAEVVVKTTESKQPKVVSNGTYAVQIGSFNSAGDAIALKKKMLAKGYSAFVVEADLGKKGLWYRVKIGPYKNSSAAQLAQKNLVKKEHIKGFVSRR